MNSRLRYLLPVLCVLGLLIAAAFSARSSHAQMTTKEEPADTLVKRVEGGAGDSTGAGAWLHVDVETSYGWFWQKSVGRAYLTKTRESKERVKAAKLCVRLVAHDSTEKCVTGQDSLVVVEHKKGMGIPKRVARVAAWTINPTRDTTRVQLAP